MGRLPGRLPAGSERGRALSGDAPLPFLVRILGGDVGAARASMVVVSHVNDVAPAGAEKVIDGLLDGAITRRESLGALRGRFGSTFFLPAATTRLAADAVLIVGLGDAERFDERRLDEIGGAIVEAAATLRVRDVATVLHGAGGLGFDPEDAASALVSGTLAAMRTIPGADALRELTIVEHTAERLPAIRRGVDRAVGAGTRVHVFVEEGALAAPPPAATETGRVAMPEHLRVGITRVGLDLKVTSIGDGSYDAADTRDYPARIAGDLPGKLREQVFAEPDPALRTEALRSIGSQLYETFLGQTSVTARLQDPPEDYVVLRLDRATVELPWELAYAGGAFLGLRTMLARQLEGPAPGRQSAFAGTRRSLDVLVVGDPTGDLPGARKEARSVARRLDRRRGVTVTELIGDVTFAALSRELDARAFDVLHYAGHARFDPLRKDASGLVLAEDRVLTAEDFATRRFLPRLVVANACHSAQTGDAALEDLFIGTQPTLGLAGGLLAAGVRSFIGGMWLIDDGAAATFASGFYTALLARGGAGTIGAAVRAARRAVVAEHGEGEPAWAAYALYGSPWEPGL